MIWQKYQSKNTLSSLLGYFWFIGLMLLTGCQTLPSTPHLAKSIALSERPRPTQTTNPQHLSGYYPISSGADAYATRSALTSTASQSIDVQYYIWHDDEAGLLMLQHLWKSAERGVMVRLLIDDFNGSASLDKKLLLFAKHPNIAVRVINPLTYRHHKFINYLTAPRRINRRMHNKSMTFDNQTSIIGGRNIGDEYLNHDQHNHFADLDVLLTGQVVSDISQSFEDYWQSAIAYDIEALFKNNNQSTYEEAVALFSHSQTLPTDSAIAQHLLSHSTPFVWTDIKFLTDDVAKLSKKSNSQDYLVNQLRQEFGRPTDRLSIISSYFVPTKDGVKTLIALAKSGIKISILTNALNATDVKATHSGYAHWRRELLSAGIKLYEFKANAKNAHDTPKTTFSLHAKAFAVDNKVFIGSYNIDPRSANTNTELGVVIHDNTLAHQLHHALNNDDINHTQILNQAYELHLVNGHLEWHTLEDGKYVVFTQEPNTNALEQISNDLMSILPLEGWL